MIEFEIKPCSFCPERPIYNDFVKFMGAIRLCQKHYEYYWFPLKTPVKCGTCKLPFIQAGKWQSICYPCFRNKKIKEAEK